MEIAAACWTGREQRSRVTPEEFEADAEQFAPRGADVVADQSVCAVPSSPCSTRSPTGLSFYDYTFLHEVPRLPLCAVRTRLNQVGDGPARRAGVVSLRMGKLDWRRSRRQPRFVTAEVMRGKPCACQSRPRYCAVTSRNCTSSAAKLSLAAHLADVLEGFCVALARALARHFAASKRRAFNRLAVSGIYARLTATAVEAGCGKPSRRPVGAAASL